MLNHSNDPNGVFGYDPLTKKFRVLCIKPCKKGEEVNNFTSKIYSKNFNNFFCKVFYLLWR